MRLPEAHGPRRVRVSRRLPAPRGFTVRVDGRDGRVLRRGARAASRQVRGRGRDRARDHSTGAPDARPGRMRAAPARNGPLDRRVVPSRGQPPSLGRGSTRRRGLASVGRRRIVGGLRVVGRFRLPPARFVGRRSRARVVSREARADVAPSRSPKRAQTPPRQPRLNHRRLLQSRHDPPRRGAARGRRRLRRAARRGGRVRVPASRTSRLDAVKTTPVTPLER